MYSAAGHPAGCASEALDARDLAEQLGVLVPVVGIGLVYPLVDRFRPGDRGTVPARGAPLAAAAGGVTPVREGPNNGQTFGKQIVGIRVVASAGHPVTLGGAANPRGAVWRFLA